METNIQWRLRACLTLLAQYHVVLCERWGRPFRSTCSCFSSCIDCTELTYRARRHWRTCAGWALASGKGGFGGQPLISGSMATLQLVVSVEEENLVQ